MKLHEYEKNLRALGVIKKFKKYLNIHWHKTLPEYLEMCDKHNRTYEECVGGAFPFAETKEGVIYWAHIQQNKKPQKL